MLFVYADLLIVYRSNVPQLYCPCLFHNYIEQFMHNSLSSFVPREFECFMSFSQSSVGPFVRCNAFPLTQPIFRELVAKSRRNNDNNNRHFSKSALASVHVLFLQQNYPENPQCTITQLL